MGLHIDWFDPSLFDPSKEAIQQDTVPLGHENLQVSLDSAVEMNVDGPMPFSSRLAGYTLGMGFNQGKATVLD